MYFSSLGHTKKFPVPLIIKSLHASRHIRLVQVIPYKDIRVLHCLVTVTSTVLHFRIQLGVMRPSDTIRAPLLVFCRGNPYPFQRGFSKIQPPLPPLASASENHSFGSYFPLKVFIGLIWTTPLTIGISYNPP